jgi:hypothetical protein
MLSSRSYDPALMRDFPLPEPLRVGGGLAINSAALGTTMGSMSS